MGVLDNIKEGLTNMLPPSAQKPGLNDETFDDRPPYSNATIVAHAFQMFFVFLALCCFAAVAAFQAQWGIGPSFLSGFALFVAVTGFVLSAYMLLVPFIYWKYDKLKYLARPIREIRIKLILSVAGTIWLLLISFITTISAWTEAGCQNPANDPNAKLGEKFQDSLMGWCTTKKAGAAFFWMTFCVWLVTLGLTVLEWRETKHTRPKDPPFIHPIETLHEEDEPFDAREHDDEIISHKTSIHDEEQPVRSPFRDSYAASTHSVPASTHSVPAAGRPSMETYGAFSDPAPTGFSPVSGISRTMQYADPYAAIRTNLERTASPTSPSPRSQNPPAYDFTGYR